MALPSRGLTWDVRRGQKNMRQLDMRRGSLRDLSFGCGQRLRQEKSAICTTIVHFLVFSQRFFSMATSFRMTSFASREAMTTAEPPELLTFLYSEFIMYKHNL